MGRDSLRGPASEYIAGELRAQRARISMTIERLVELSEVKRGTVMRTLSGEAAIAVDVLIPIAYTLGLDPGELLNAARDVMPPIAAADDELRTSMSDEMTRAAWRASTNPSHEGGGL